MMPESIGLLSLISYILQYVSVTYNIFIFPFKIFMSHLRYLIYNNLNTLSTFDLSACSSTQMEIMLKI